MESYSMEKTDVITALNSLMEEKMHIKLSEDNRNSALLGSSIKLEARHLVYLLYYVEEKFQIIISSESICQGLFSTFNNIAELIYLKLSGKRT